MNTTSQRSADELDPRGAVAGEILRDIAIELVAGNRTSLIAWLQKSLVDLYRERQSGETPWVNGDDATRLLDKIEYNGEYRVIGAVFRPGKGWKPVGTVKSTLARRNRRPICCWKWVGEESS